MRHYLSIVGFAAIAFFVIAVPTLAQRPPICLDPKGHLVWPGQSASAIPMRSPATADTLANSPITASGTNITVAGNVQANGLCLGSVCVTNFSNLNSFWQQTPTNANNISNSNSGNVGVGTANPQYKLDVQGSFRVVDSSGTERIVIRDSAPTTQAPNQRNQAQVKSAYAQTAVPDRWVELFGGAAYFRKIGQNSDVFLQVGDANTGESSIRSKGQQPSVFLADENNKSVGRVWYSRQNKSIILQSIGGATDQNTAVPVTTLELLNNTSVGSLPSMKLWGGPTPQTQRLIIEISEE